MDHEEWGAGLVNSEWTSDLTGDVRRSIAEAGSWGRAPARRGPTDCLTGQPNRRRGSYA